jgi:hypothetical protein
MYQSLETMSGIKTFLYAKNGEEAAPLKGDVRQLSDHNSLTGCMFHVELSGVSLACFGIHHLWRGVAIREIHSIVGDSFEETRLLNV